ncbi:hypothetical protein EYF80_052664 [Liparis tanakae]|uniref:Uncharacterized protein n=1 Tax=Liparis tanakae TaxID=230148 RepID=A0A4Z2F7J7_9TELE|nr:hypothetical protein EYF80_052664 [Liparis tanakae]
MEERDMLAEDGMLYDDVCLGTRATTQRRLMPQPRETFASCGRGITAHRQQEKVCVSQDDGDGGGGETEGGGGQVLQEPFKAEPQDPP